MKYGMNHLSLAVRLALTAGVFTAAGAVQAQDATTTNAPQADETATPPAKAKAKTLEGLVVTG